MMWRLTDPNCGSSLDYGIRVRRPAAIVLSKFQTIRSARLTSSSSVHFCAGECQLSTSLTGFCESFRVSTLLGKLLTLTQLMPGPLLPNSGNLDQ